MSMHRLSSATTALTVFALALLLGASVSAAQESGLDSTASASSTYDDLASQATAHVDAVLNIGGTNWLRLYANGAAWGALYNALRSDISTALAVPYHSVNLTTVSASDRGILVNYSVQVLQSDAARIEAKVAQIAAGGTSMPATALVYQTAALPVGSNPAKFVPKAISDASVYLERTSDAFTTAVHVVVVWSSVAAVVVMTAFVM